ncbi:hypothetical protein A3860_16050 [Niastella vici]|uniref:Adhesin domain-containing protein n=1 Tax=Niastella vici TaxID=1703345 RepID=A0A1V9G3Q6_9BACT|nr:hypothetical protein [Niastella vici]OQP65184.1 hypothetical protein A3860_16050 [Niastella vici]
MTATLKKYSTPLLFACLLTSAQVRAEGPDVEKKKTYTKSYTVSNSDNVSFNNQFGELKINTWDKNEVKVTVTITAEASTDEKAQTILDHISIEDGKTNEGVYFNTKLDKQRDNNWSNGEKTRFRIDYVVNMPARNPLTAKNDFGPMVIDDYSGEVTLESKYGSMTTGKLGNVKRVDIEYGKGTIESINNGSLIIKYSKASIGNIDGNVNAVIEYSTVSKLGVDNNAKALTVKNSYSKLNVNVNANISANFDISTSYGNLHNNTNFDIKEEGADGDRYGPRFNKRYQGKSGSGNIAMKIKSEYGQVTLTHDSNSDMNDDDNRKEKNKNKDKDKEKDKEKDKDKKTAVRI